MRTPAPSQATTMCPTSGLKRPALIQLTIQFARRQPSNDDVPDERFETSSSDPAHDPIRTPGAGAAFRAHQTYAWTRDGFKVAALIVRHAADSGRYFTFDLLLDIAKEVIPEVQIDQL